MTPVWNDIVSELCIDFECWCVLLLVQDMCFISASWDRSIRVYDDSVNGEVHELR